jgi:hypothetical protein
MYTVSFTMVMPLGEQLLTEKVRFGFSMPVTPQVPSQVGQP